MEMPKLGPGGSALPQNQMMIISIVMMVLGLGLIFYAIFTW